MVKDEDIQALFSKGVPETEVYDILIHQVLSHLAEDVSRATAKAGEASEDRLAHVREHIALASVVSSTLILEEIDPEAIHDTLMELAEMVSEGMEQACADTTCACHEAGMPDRTLN